MARPAGRPVDIPEQMGPAVLGALAAAVVIALAGIPYLLSPGRLALRTPSPIKAAAGAALAPADRQAVESLVRARLSGTQSNREMNSSLSWGVNTKLKQLDILSREQVNASTDVTLRQTLGAFATRNQTVGYDEYALARVTYTTTAYFYNNRAKRGNSAPATERMNSVYLGFGKKAGRWYILP